MIAIIMIVYQWFMIISDLAQLLLKAGVIIISTVYHFFLPREKKNIGGEIALVTGAGHGIGKELALQLSRLGVKVICCDINESWNNDTVEKIKAEDGIAWGYKLDVSDREQVKTVMDKVKDDVGEITILINNAGIMPCKSFMKHTPEVIENLFKINVFAHFWTIREWLPVFQSRGTGHIVALSSIAGLMGTSNLVPYCSSKFAVTGLMDGLKEELRYDNRYPEIKLTTVHPFIIDTGLVHKPRVRFPALNPILKPDKAAEIIIDGIQREHKFISIPPKDFYIFKLCSILPPALTNLLVDFMEAEVDEHDD